MAAACATASANTSTVPSYTQVNLGVSHDFNLVSPTKPTTLRFDVVNLFDTHLRDQGRLRHRRVRAAIRAAPRFLFRHLAEAVKRWSRVRAQR